MRTMLTLAVRRYCKDPACLEYVTVTSQIVVTPTKSTTSPTKSSTGTLQGATDKLHYEGGWAFAALLAVLGAIGML